MKKTLSIILLTAAITSQKTLAEDGCAVETKVAPISVQIDYGVAEGWTQINNISSKPFLSSDSRTGVLSIPKKRKIFIKDKNNNVYVSDVFTFPVTITISEITKSKDGKPAVKYTMKTTTWIHSNKLAKQITEKEFHEKRKVAKSIIEKYKSNLKKATDWISKEANLDKLKNTLKTQEELIKSTAKTVGYNKEKLLYETMVKIELQKRIYKLNAEKAKIEKKAAEEKFKKEKEKQIKEKEEKQIKEQKKLQEIIKNIENEKIDEKIRKEKIEKEKEAQKKHKAEEDLKEKEQLKGAEELLKMDLLKPSEEQKNAEEELKKLEEDAKKMDAELADEAKKTEKLEKEEVPAPEKDELGAAPDISGYDKYEQEKEAKKAADKKAKEDAEKAKKASEQKKAEPKKGFTDKETTKIQLIKRQIQMNPSLDSLSTLKDEELLKLDQKAIDDVIKKFEGIDEQDIEDIGKEVEKIVAQKNEGSAKNVDLMALMKKQIEDRKKAKAEKKQNKK